MKLLNWKNYTLRKDRPTSPTAKRHHGLQLLWFSRRKKSVTHNSIHSLDLSGRLQKISTPYIKIWPSHHRWLAEGSRKLKIDKEKIQLFTADHLHSTCMLCPCCLNPTYIENKSTNTNSTGLHLAQRACYLSSGWKRNPRSQDRHGVHKDRSSEKGDKASKVRASGRRLGTAGSAWPPSRIRLIGMVAPTMACGLPAPLSGRQLEGWFKEWLQTVS
jgi:hypothetical protein